MITIRKWPDDSADLLNDLYSHVNQKYCLTQLACPLDEQATGRYLDAVRTGIVDGKPFLCFAVLLDEEVIGKVDLTRYEGGFAETDIVLKEQYTGEGYGPEAMKLVLDLVSDMDWCSAVGAYVDKDNIHARRMFTRAGFRQGRPFEADIMIPSPGRYILKTTTGYEYLYRFPEVL